MTRVRYTSLVMGLGLLVTLAGCGGDMGSVSGTVTLDGKPLPAANVLFQPQEGRPSVAVTDQSGRYTLMYQPNRSGAKVGSYKVSISTVGQDEDGKQIPERVPAKYNTKSELTREVKPGSNTIDFDLKSKG